MPEPLNQISFDALISYPVAKILCKMLHRIPFMHPNIITIARLIPAFMFYMAYLNNGYSVSLGLLAFTIFMGCLDGAYARMYNLSSPFGAVLNHHITTLIHTFALLCVVYKKHYYYSVCVFLMLDFMNKKGWLTPTKNWFRARFTINAALLNKDTLTDNGILLVIFLYRFLF
jgi:hypothetical protein